MFNRQYKERKDNK